MRALLALLLAAVLFTAFAESSLAQTKSSSNSNAVVSMERKLHHVESNAALALPNQNPTEITEQEINAYFAAGGVARAPRRWWGKLQGAPGFLSFSTRAEIGPLNGGGDCSNSLRS